MVDAATAEVVAELAFGCLGTGRAGPVQIDELARLNSDDRVAEAGGTRGADRAEGGRLWRGLQVAAEHERHCQSGRAHGQDAHVDKQGTGTTRRLTDRLVEQCASLLSHAVCCLPPGSPAPTPARTQE